jgi:hypothetical protein
MPNATTQLVVDLLFRRGVFFFSRGIREDVLGNLFSSKYLLWEQVKAENEEGWTMRLQSRAKERIEVKLTLEWCVSLVERYSPRLAAFPCPHGLGVFSYGEAGREDVR